ncbi:hypothetical protein LCGC14_0164930 [marine sediment metagenome]|uniref:Uncharacterized protein n=1 Tax=marine sediment metagenome TaxID=412755 RepID=A0A0F9UYQ4_9ZZZZ
MLKDMAPDFLPHENGGYLYAEDIHTAAWYNGREDGIVIWFRPGFTGPAIVLVVVEHRNIDQICVDVWHVDEPCFGDPPTWKDYPESFTKYDDTIRKTFDYGNAGAAAQYIYGRLETWFKENKPSTSSFDEVSTALAQE